MKLIKLTEHCFYTPNDKMGDRPTLGYIKGKNHALMVDAGASPQHVADYQNALHAQQLKNPELVAITHWHWDHTFGMCAVPGITIAHQKTNDKLAEMAQWEWTDEAMKQRLETQVEIEFADTHIREEYADVSQIKVVPATMCFEDEMMIDLGGISVLLKHVESPHSEDSVIVSIPSEKVVFVGDAISVDYYNNNYLDKNKLQALLHSLKAIEFDICLTGHNEPISRDKTLSVMESLLQR